MIKATLICLYICMYPYLVNGFKTLGNDIVFILRYIIYVGAVLTSGIIRKIRKFKNEG